MKFFANRSVALMPSGTQTVEWQILPLTSIKAELFLTGQQEHFLTELVRQKDQRPHGFRGEFIRSPATRNLPDVGMNHVDASVHGMAQFFRVRQHSVAVNQLPKVRRDAVAGHFPVAFQPLILLLRHVNCYIPAVVPRRCALCGCFSVTAHTDTLSFSGRESAHTLPSEVERRSEAVPLSRSRC